MGILDIEILWSWSAALTRGSQNSVKRSCGKEGFYKGMLLFLTDRGRVRVPRTCKPLRAAGPAGVSVRRCTALPVSARLQPRCSESPAKRHPPTASAQPELCQQHPGYSQSITRCVPVQGRGTHGVWNHHLTQRQELNLKQGHGSAFQGAVSHLHGRFHSRKTVCILRNRRISINDCRSHLTEVRGKGGEISGAERSSLAAFGKQFMLGSTQLESQEFHYYSDR